MKNEQPELMNHTIIRQPSNYTNPDPAQSLSSMIALMRELSGILDSFHLSLKLHGAPHCESPENAVSQKPNCPRHQFLEKGPH